MFEGEWTFFPKHEHLSVYWGGGDISTEIINRNPPGGRNVK